MGLIKQNNYDGEELRFATISNALAHPARKRIIEMTQTEDLVYQAVLPEMLNLCKTAVHNHILVMRKADLIDEYYFTHYSQIKLNIKTMEVYMKELERLTRTD